MRSLCLLKTKAAMLFVSSWEKGRLPFGSGNRPPASSPRGCPSSSMDSDPSPSSPSGRGNAPWPQPSLSADPGSSSPSLAHSLPSFSEICRLQVATLYHVPKAVRDIWADILSFALRSVVDCPEDLEAWSRLFMLPKCILFLPPFKVRRSLISLIRERIKAGSFLDLWEKACNRASSNLTS